MEETTANQLPQKAMTIAALVVAFMFISTSGFGETTKEKAEHTVLPHFQLKDVSLPDALKLFTAATGIEVTYVPCKIQPGMVEINFINITAASALDFMVRGPLVIRYEDRGIRVEPESAGLVAGVPDENMTAHEYCTLGFSKRENKDYEGAIAACTAGIKLDPNDRILYEQRAVAKESKNDLDGAISDWTNAIRVEANSKHQAVIYGGRYLAALYVDRGALKHISWDFRDAINDYTIALQCNPNFCDARYLRGIAKLLEGDQGGCLKDFQEYAKSRSYSDAHSYVHIDIWILLMKLGRKAEANEQLVDYLNGGEERDLRLHHGQLPGPRHTDFDDVVHYLWGELPETDFLDINQYSPEFAYSHYYYAGMKRLLMGDRASALDLLEKYLKTPFSSELDEYFVVQAPFSCHRQLVQVQLKALGK